MTQFDSNLIKYSLYCILNGKWETSECILQTTNKSGQQKKIKDK